MTELTVAILAGGKSSRMGHNKALIQIGGQPIIEHVIDVANKLSPSELLIVTNTPQDYEHLEYRLVADTITGQGAIGGIVSALHHSQTDAILALACDMPFVQPSLLNILIHKFHDGDFQAVIPTVDDYPQGVLAIYHQECLPYFETAIQNNQRKLKTIFSHLECIAYIDETYWQSADPHRHSFININTPEDLAFAQELWKQHND